MGWTTASSYDAARSKSARRVTLYNNNSSVTSSLASSVVSRHLACLMNQLYVRTPWTELAKKCVIFVFLAYSFEFNNANSLIEMYCNHN